jgi:hypothetical protein
MFKWIVPVAAALALGVLIGCIPVVNEHLQWNLWYVVPISGLLLGAVFGALEFWICYRINLKVSGWSFFRLAAAAMLAYAATDLGIYLTMKIPVAGVEGIPDGEHRVADLITFTQYMKLRLGSSKIAGARPAEKGFEMGATGTTISYAVDLLGALLGATGALLLGTESNPFCDTCSRYKRRARKYELALKTGSDPIEELLGEIQKLVAEGNFQALFQRVRDASATHKHAKPDAKIAADVRFCPTCHVVTLLGSVSRLHGNEWKTINELAFQLTSEPGTYSTLTL